MAIIQRSNILNFWRSIKGSLGESKTDRSGVTRVVRTRYPAFVGRIIDLYDPGTTGKETYTHKGKKICLDMVFDECPASKLQWAAKKGIDYFLFQESKEE